MKTKLFLSLVVAITFGLILSCASAPQGPPIEPGSLIGTKWLPATPAPFRLSLEFIDEKDCYYTVGSTRYQTPYTVRGNTITLPAFHTSWVLKDDTLYDGRNPFFVKA